MRVGVLGVGAMGAPIAAAFAEGHDVQVFDADDGRLRDAGLTGARRAASVDELIGGSDVVVTVLPGPREVEAVVLGSAARFARGACWLDLSTGDPRTTSRIASALTARGVDSVAAPMGGGPARARDRSLHFTVAGRSAAVDRIQPLLSLVAVEAGVDVIGEDPADAQTVKLLSNVLWFGQVVAVTEAMLLGRALGLDPARLREMLAARAGGSVLLRDHYEAVLRADYMPSLGIDRVVEQLTTACAVAEDHSVPFELTHLVQHIHRAALDAYGPVDGELLAARLLEERAGAFLAQPTADGLHSVG